MITPEQMSIVLAVVNRMNGTYADLDIYLDEELGVKFTREMYDFFDTKLQLCEDCGYWSPTIELDEQGCCLGCSKG